MNLPNSPEDHERRRFARVSVDFVTVEVISPVGEPGAPEFCFVLNVSENGILFRSKKEYEKGQVVIVTFKIPDEEQLMVRTEALIVHSQILDASKFYGVQFRNLGLAEHAKLRTYVTNALKNR